MNSDSSTYSPDQIQQLVIMTRLSLYNHGLYCGPEFIRQQLRCQGIKPLPSLTLIRRILKQHGLTHQRTGLYGACLPDRQE